MKRYADRNWKKAVDGNWKYNKKHHVDYFMRSYHQMIWGPRHKTSPLMGSIILSLSVNGQVPKCNANDWKPYQNQNHVMRPPDHQSKHFTVARSLRQRLPPFPHPALIFFPRCRIHLPRLIWYGQFSPVWCVLNILDGLCFDLLSS